MDVGNWSPGVPKVTVAKFRRAKWAGPVDGIRRVEDVQVFMRNRGGKRHLK
jgi:hypothetical protein